MPTVYRNVALLETVDADALEELLLGGLASFVVRRLTPTTVVVDHERLADLRKLLKRLGQTPRITMGE